MSQYTLGRRGFLGATAAAAIGTGTRRATASETGDAFVYQVQRTEEEWRAMLDDAEYAILREAGTEQPHSNPLWNEKRSGTYCCRGCDLTVYRSLHKLDLDKGWAFFRHSFRDTVLTDLDLKGGRMGDPFAELAAGLEVHCRRCGSHLGHIVALPEVPGQPIHCINGTSLRFEAAET
ncbi:MAG: peptide-methionine (R)-S-oxide reductase [Silicimonas sp.]|nr:peptide-methionine (R)-S-oxide reductase [Silicimonas sp.]NND21772.1 peptide-methionine (R)-S-oxide reductase [Silicimonas sp.]NNF90128.1 peptide-methionine (R)-S-oxide reductase [Boseongicola sp.]NNL72076.1 peptide-methionine (R)-S-oxide reductase [Silicimonas sp.]RZW12536.1 MAG: peptide-methionine (R)-S-oxide reductase [Paracoccaceae bacterium]